MNGRAALALAARVGLAGLLAYAAVLKLLEPSAFADDIDHYRMLPAPLVSGLALGLPVLEAVTALGLLLPSYAQGAALLCALMFSAFAAAMAQAKLRGINLACGCFGAGSELQVSWEKVTLDLGLAMLAGWVAMIGTKPQRPPSAAAEAA